MLEDGKITSKQFIFIIFICRIVITLTYLPALTAPPGNQDIWISDILLLPAQLVFLIPVYLLWKKYPQQTIILYCQTLLGKAGKFIGILYIWFFIHFNAITLSQFGIFLKTAVMPETPILFFAVSIMLVCAYAAQKGIEVIGRISEIVGIIIIISVISIVLLLSKDMDLQALTPMLEKGLFPVIHGAVTPSARTVEILAIAMILPYLNNSRKVKTTFVSCFTIITILFLLIDIPTITTLGIEEAKSRVFPFFSATRIISVGNFIERIEVINVGIMVLGIFVKLSFYFYLTVLGIGQLFNFKDYKPLVLPVGTVIIPLSTLIAPSIVELNKFLSYKIFTWYAMFFILFIPIILLLIAIVKKKGVAKG